MKGEADMNLATSYLGLALRHPVVAAASPLSASVDGILRLADAGAAAVVMASVYEEQIVAQELAEAALWSAGQDSHAEMGAYFTPQTQARVLDGRLNTLRRAAERAGVPVIASLNGCTDEGWLDFARQMEQAGASAIELNFSHIPTDITQSAQAVEAEYADVVRRVCAGVDIPVSVKMPATFTAPGHVVRSLLDQGAAGVVLFSRFYGPGLDIAVLEPDERLRLSTPGELNLALMWLSLLSARLGGSFAAGCGVWSAADVVRCLLAGASVVTTASALLEKGPGHIGTLVTGLRAWMHAQGHESLADFQGRCAARGTPEEARAFVRREYYRLMTLPVERVTGV